MNLMEKGSASCDAKAWQLIVPEIMVIRSLRARLITFGNTELWRS